MKVMRRSRLPYQSGGDGALAAPAAYGTAAWANRFTASDGEVFNATTGTTEGDRDKLSCPSIASVRGSGFISADVGRFIKLTVTPPQSGTAGTAKNDNWVFRISAVVSSTIVRLEGARFEDASSAGAGTIKWVLLAQSQFTAASGLFSSDATLGQGGSSIDQYISLPSATNTQLKYAPWRIGLVVDGTNLTISDWTGNIAAFPTGVSSLTWIRNDRQAYNFEDLFKLLHPFMIACGWNVKGAQATGAFTCAATPVSGDTIHIWDGGQRRAWEFNNSTPGTNHTAVAITTSNASANATAMAAAINGTGNLTATAVGAIVNVTCTLYDAKGNTNIFASTGATSFSVISGMSGGATPGQFRGRNNGVQTASSVVNDGIMQDVIYFSAGESDPVNPKRMFTRITKFNNNALGNGAGQISFDFAMWQGWDPAYASNGSTHNKGNGINPVKSPGCTGASLGAADAVQAATNVAVQWYSATPSTTCMLLSTYAELGINNFGIFGGEMMAIDYAFMGDKDEIHLFIMMDGIGANYVGLGAVNEVNQNPQRFMVRAAATAGSNVAIDVGPNVDPQGVTNRDGSALISPPYQVGDNLQAAGLAVTGTAPTGGAFIESDVITAFGTVAAGATNPDGLDYSISVATLNKNLAIGDIVGEEAVPFFVYWGPHAATFGSAGNVRLQNAAQNNDATYFDWDGHGTASTNDGFQGTDGLATLGGNVISEVDPNHRGGRWGLVPVVFRNTVAGEFRGRMRYYWITSPRLPSWQWVQDRNGNWYLLIPYGLRQTNTFKIALGPVSLAQARPYG